MANQPEHREGKTGIGTFSIDQLIAPFNAPYPHSIEATFLLRVTGLPNVQCKISFDSKKRGNPLSANLWLPRFIGTDEIIPGSRDIFKELALQVALPGRINVALPEENQHRDSLIYEKFKPYGDDPHDAWENPSTIPPDQMFIFTRNPILDLRNIFIRFHFYPSGKLSRELQMFVDKSE